ncbi:MAG: hypothetical protein AAF849_11465 [Bacteroidota bacterium]
MSGFQAYKFRSIDRLLTSEEQDEISSWSSRTRATANGATFTYSYGSFPKNKAKVLKEYFDLLLYFDNWGTHQLMLKFPIDLVDYEAMQAYDINADHAYTTHLAVSKTASHAIVDFYWAEEEDGYWAEEDDFEVSDFISIREAILKGNYSALYLFWLKLAEFKANWEKEKGNPKTPPVPPKLRYAGASMQPFIELLKIDKDLIAAAKTASKSVANKEAKKDYKALIQQLSEVEKEDYLWQLLQGELRLEIKLKKHLDSFVSTPQQDTASISLAEIKAQQAKEQINREAAEQRAAEKAHRQKMEKMAKERDMHWKSVFFNLDRKSGKSYDIATATLVDLKALSHYENQEATFQAKMQQIKKDYGRSGALLNRFRKAKL